jgi:DNA-binding response OmpR family regulator
VNGTTFAHTNGDMSKPSILIVEMDPQVAGAYELFLAGRGYRVFATSSLAGVLRAIAAEAPGIVVLGNLPDTVDTGTVAARVRAVAAPRPVGIIALAPTMDEILTVDLVIPRGAHPRALLDAIRTTLRRRPVTAPLATAS